MDSTANPTGENNEKIRSWVHSLDRDILGVEGCVEAPKWKLRRVKNKSITHTNLHKPNNKLINA